MRLAPLLYLPLAAALTAVPARAQLRLADALRAADAGAVANRVADGDRAARDAQTITPLHGILPSARVEASLIRTTDPVAAFGTQLRQRRITQADFDPALLNFPSPITNYGGGIVFELPLLNADAWIARTAAMRGARAARASESWTRLSTRADVVRAFYGAVLAAERASTLDTAVRAARAHVREAESLARNGVVTPSDAMLAGVKAGDLEADLLGARADAALARRALAVLIGGDGNSRPNPPAPSRRRPHCAHSPEPTRASHPGIARTWTPRDWPSRQPAPTSPALARSSCPASTRSRVPTGTTPGACSPATGTGPPG